MTIETLKNVFLIVTTMLIVVSIFTNEDDDDHDGPDKGIMSPVYQGV
jgi:hypothetical protein